MNPEWMPVNPCSACCDEKECNSVAYCPIMAKYDFAMDYQHKLLEYLIDQCQVNYQKGILPPVVTRQELQEMKLQLEESK